MKFRPPFFFTRAPAQDTSPRVASDRAAEFLRRPVAHESLAYSRFTYLLGQYKRAVLERLETSLNAFSLKPSFSPTQPTPMSTNYHTSVVDTHRDTRWVINKWHVQFLFSERMLVSIKHRSKVPNWYEDIDVATEYMAQLEICFNTIGAFYESFGSLPIIGDRLFDEDTGLIIVDRSIDGGLRTVTFVLSE